MVLDLVLDLNTLLGQEEIKVTILKARRAVSAKEHGMQDSDKDVSQSLELMCQLL